MLGSALHRVRDLGRALTQVGVHAGLSSDMAKRIVLTNQMSISFCLAWIAFFIGFAVVGLVNALPLIALFILIEASWIYFNHLGRYNISRMGLLILTQFMGLPVCWIVGPQGMVHIGYMALVPLSVLLFRRDEKIQKWAGVILPLLFYTAAEQLYPPGHLFNPDAARIIHFLTYPIFFLIIFLAGRYLIEVNFQIETALKLQSIELEQQKLKSIQSSKMAALGEMAGGIAHEINTPLAAIKLINEGIEDAADSDPVDRPLIKDMTRRINITITRISKIILGLRSFSRDGSHDPFQVINLGQLIDETLSFCSAKFKSEGTTLIVEEIDPDAHVEGRSTEISQALLNLLNNAHDAIAQSKEKWIKISVRDAGDTSEIRVIDSGNPIPLEVRPKLFQPFFTTKEIGKGTGLGLSIALGIVRSHEGSLSLDTQSPNTCFVMKLPKKASLKKE